jgi:RimJ/RimL family protein N-acetyltransferase
MPLNPQGQPIGEPLPEWTARPFPPLTPIAGRFCRVEPLDIERHSADLFQANSDDETGSHWTYLFTDAPPDLAAYRTWAAGMLAGRDPMPFAIIDQASGKAIGVASYMRIDPASGALEIGHINYSPRLQRTPAATEAMYLLMRRAFDELGYRRYEWKCDSLNAPSRAAAARYGFSFEGIFRKALVYKKRSRDTAWFAIIDSDWPRVRAGFEQWLAAGNFDEQGQQRRRLSDCMAAAAA